MDFDADIVAYINNKPRLAKRETGWKSITSNGFQLTDSDLDINQQEGDVFLRKWSGHTKCSSTQVTDCLNIQLNCDC